MNFALISVTMLLAQVAAPGFDVVLGSYQYRDIALREMVKFSACKQPLQLISSEQSEGLTHRIVDGPYARFDDAEIVRGLWLECGVSDAWVKRRQITD